MRRGSSVVCRALIASIAFSLLLSVVTSSADEDPPPTPEAVAEDVLAAVSSGDEARLQAFSSREEPDLWLVVDVLLARGERSVAQALAHAASDVEAAARSAYVEHAPADEPSLREALRAARAAYERGDLASVSDLVEAASPLPATVCGVRLRLQDGLARREQGLVAESVERLRVAAETAERMGWLRFASFAFHEAGQTAWARSEWSSALAAWERRLVIEEARGDQVAVAQVLGNLGNVHRARGDLEKAQSCHDRSLALFEQLGDEHGRARALANLSSVQSSLGEYEQARASGERALKALEALGDAAGAAQVLGILGTVQAARGEDLEAIPYYERALEALEVTGNRRGMGVVLTALGNVYENLGDYPRALSCLERALEIREEIGDPVGLNAVLVALGNVYGARGDFPRARSLYERVLRSIEALGDHVSTAGVLNNLGMVHRVLGEYAQALSCYERSLALFEERHDRAGMAVTLGNLGVVYDNLGKLPQACAVYERSLGLHEELGNRRGVATVLANLGRLHQQGGDSAAAVAYIQHALELWEALGNRAALGACLVSIGDVRRDLGDAQDALSLYERALALREALGDRAGAALARERIGRTYLTVGRPDQALPELEHAARDFRRLRMSDAQVSCAAVLGQVHLLLGAPARALLTVQGALRDLETLLGGLAESEGGALREKRAGIFEVGAVAASALGDPASFATFLEAGRAGSLLETLGAGRAVRFSDLPRALLDVEEEAKALEARARWEHGRAIASGNVRGIRRAATAVDEAMDRRREVAARIQREAKRIAGVFYPRAATLEEIQGWLEPGMALVLYGLCLDQALGLVLTPEGERIVPLGSRADAEALCARAGPLLAQPGDRGRLDPEASEPGSPDVDAIFASLRQTLVAPLALGDDVQTVLVSPDGPLGYLPWGALFDVPVACVPSGTAWVLLREEEREPGERILALGDPDYGDRPTEDRAVAIYTRGGGLTPLPATRDEATAIGDAVLLGADANETKLQEALKQQRRWRAVHLACHGLVDTERPTLSSLALTPTDEDDGFLTCLDVFRMEVPADLVTLSACETAKGKVVKAEGIVGLTRAFMYAGAPRVLCSLWKVDDEATRALMTRFYELWAPDEGAGLSAAEALREAQAFIRTQEKWAHPYYWAAWVLWGLAE